MYILGPPVHSLVLSLVVLWLFTYGRDYWFRFTLEQLVRLNGGPVKCSRPNCYSVLLNACYMFFLFFFRFKLNMASAYNSGIKDPSLESVGNIQKVPCSNYHGCPKCYICKKDKTSEGQTDCMYIGVRRVCRDSEKKSTVYFVVGFLRGKNATTEFKLQHTPSSQCTMSVTQAKEIVSTSLQNFTITFDLEELRQN